MVQIAILNGSSSFAKGHLARLRELGTGIIHDDTTSEVQAVVRLKDVEIALVDGFKMPLNRAVIESGAHLQLLALNSTAFHMVDLNAARERGIKVAKPRGLPSGWFGASAEENRMIERRERDGIVTLRLAHGKASALDVELLEALRREVGKVADSTARAVVLTGTGTIFSAGVDLFRVLDGGAGYLERFLPDLARTLRALFTFPKPTVAAVNGHAIAGGCILATACDRRLMARGAGRIGVPELLVGVPFPSLALEIVRFAVPSHYLQEVVYAGATYDAAEAHARGIVDEVTNPEELEERAHEVAVQLASIPAGAFRLTKENLRRPALERADCDAVAADARALAVWQSPATHEHIRGYLERTIRKKG